MKLEKNGNKYTIDIENLLEEQKFNILIELMENCDIQSIEEIERNYKKYPRITTIHYLTKENDEYIFKSIDSLKEIKKI